MQLFGLINTLLLQEPQTCRRNLTIQVTNFSLYFVKVALFSQTVRHNQWKFFICGVQTFSCNHQPKTYISIVPALPILGIQQETWCFILYLYISALQRRAPESGLGADWLGAKLWHPARSAQGLQGEAKSTAQHRVQTHAECLYFIISSYEFIITILNAVLQLAWCESTSHFCQFFEPSNVLENWIPKSSLSNCEIIYLFQGRRLKWFWVLTYMVV